MCEEGVGKLRLKPRKAPPAQSREPSPGAEPPPRRRTLADRCSWFEKDDLNECEKTWILLLKGISQDLQRTSWQAVPSFPEFFRKSSEEDSQQKREVFTVRTKDFQWVSFPSYCKEECLNPEDLGSPELTQSRSDLLPEGQGQVGRLNSLPSTGEETDSVTIADPAKNMVGEDIQDISTLRPKSCEVPQGRRSTLHSALSQSHVEAVSFQQQCRGAVQHGRDNRKELHIPTHQGNASFGGTREVPAEGESPVNTLRTGSCQETENQSEGVSTLDSCPMCLLHFSGTLSQLDIDGHLARCLSESADDVMW